jgi:hypothetical protein
MFSRIRRRATYANVVATLALVFAMSGGALAAARYIITSTKQIKPSVLTAIAKQAKGATGAAGPAGPAGQAGQAGPQGVPGATGTNGTNGVNGKEGPPGPTEFKALPSGQSEHGVWGFKGDPGEGEEFLPISFAIPLKEALTSAHVVLVGPKATGPAKECESGTSAEPKAAPGNLCIYEIVAEPATPEEEFAINPEEKSRVELQGAGKSGTILHWEGLSTETLAYGVWVVTQK